MLIGQGTGGHLLCLWPTSSPPQELTLSREFRYIFCGNLWDGYQRRPEIRYCITGGDRVPAHSKKMFFSFFIPFSTILVPSNSNLIYPIWINLANFNNPELINLRGLSKVLLQVRSFAGNVLYEPPDLQPIERWQQWRKRVREEEAPWKPLIWIWDFTFFFLKLFGPQLLYPSSAWVNPCAFGFWVYQWLSMHRDKKCQLREAQYKGRTAKNKTEEFPWDVGMGRMEDTDATDRTVDGVCLHFLNCYPYRWECFVLWTSDCLKVLLERVERINYKMGLAKFQLMTRLPLLKILELEFTSWKIELGNPSKHFVGLLNWYPLVN